MLQFNHLHTGVKMRVLFGFVFVLSGTLGDTMYMIYTNGMTKKEKKR